MNHEVIKKIYTNFANENIYPIPKKSLVNYIRAVFHLETRLKTSDLKPTELSPELQQVLKNFVKELWNIFEIINKQTSQNAKLAQSLGTLRNTIEFIDEEVNHKIGLPEQVTINTQKSQEDVKSMNISRQESTAATRAFYEKTAEEREDQELNLKGTYEEEMLDLTSQMKNIARSYAEQLKADNTILDELNKSQDSNIANVQSKNNDLDDFLKRSKSLGLFRLMFMGIVAILLFSFTVVIIVVDHRLFG